MSYSKEVEWLNNRDTDLYEAKKNWGSSIQIERAKKSIYFNSTKFFCGMRWEELY